VNELSGAKISGSADSFESCCESGEGYWVMNGELVSARFGSCRSDGGLEELDVSGFVGCDLFEASSNERLETCSTEGVCVVFGEEGGVEVIL